MDESMKSNNLLLSVIVPIYMVEDYLPKCIETILNQTYTNLEVLLINDGSLDQCGLICEEYAKKDSRIKVFHKKNGGICDALNYGLGYATGDYIAFVDGDDYISNMGAFYALIKEASKEQADIVVGNYHKDMKGKLIPTKEHGFRRNSNTLCSNFRFRGFYCIGHLAYTWGKIYKHSFLLKNHLKVKNFRYAMDKLFNVECYINNPKYSFIDDSVYVYRHNGSSISHNYKEGYAEIWLKISEEMYREIQIIMDRKEYMDLVAYNLLFAVFFSCKQEYRHMGNRRKAIVTELKKYRSNILMQKFMKEVSHGKYLSFHTCCMWKLLLWGLSLGLSLRLYNTLSIGIKFLIDCKMDARLSSIGRVKKHNRHYKQQ